MVTRKWVIGVMGLVLALAVAASACGPKTGMAETAVTDATPREVVEQFYQWYVGYEGNPLVDRAYRSSEHLTGELIGEVDTALDSFEGGGFDPFLCAQDIPADFSVEDGTISGEEAVVVLRQVWNPGTDFESTRDIEVTLEHTDGQWRIRRVGCDSAGAEVSAPVGAEMAPEAVASAFYDWYLAYSRESGNPLVDGAYRASDYLTPGFIEQVDATLASFEGGGYDPFLCAQDIPGTISVGNGSVVDDKAVVPVGEVWNAETEYELARELEVTLVKAGDGWQIDGISCPAEEAVADPTSDGPMPGTPEEALDAFYSWYLWYAREVGNPLVDKAYQTSEYLTPSLVEKVDEIIASFDRGAYDPFLCAQDVPEWVEIEAMTAPSAERAAIVARTSFEGHTFTVELVESDGRWALSDIICQAAGGEAGREGWQVFLDDEHGYQFAYPEGWTIEEATVADDSLPIKRVLSLVPAGWAGGSPAVSIEVGVGNLAEVSMWPVSDADKPETMTIGEYTVLTATGPYGERFYVFGHPADSTRHVALRDQTGDEPGPDLTAAVEGMLASFAFVAD